VKAEAPSTVAPIADTDRDGAGFELEAVDLEALIAHGIPGTRWVLEPWLPEASICWLFGSAAAGKSIVAAAWTAGLTRAGFPVAYVSSENPLAVDVDRFRRLRPDFRNLRLFHGTGIDLNDRAHLVELALRSQGAVLIVIDTLTACWSGDEASNTEVARLDREVLRVLGRLTGACILVLHHVGHPQPFMTRKGVHAGRGASSMGQKADVTLNISSGSPGEFTLEASKNRYLSGVPQPPTRFRIVDLPDGGLTVEATGPHTSPRVDECADAALEIVAADGPVSTRGLRQGLIDRGFGGVTIDAALHFLRGESPARVSVEQMDLVGGDGKTRKAKGWAVA
jgi:hypothetical protein